MELVSADTIGKCWHNVSAKKSRTFTIFPYFRHHRTKHNEKIDLVKMTEDADKCLYVLV